MMNYLASLLLVGLSMLEEHKVKLLAHFGIGLRGQFPKHQMFLNLHKFHGFLVLPIVSFMGYF